MKFDAISRRIFGGNISDRGLLHEGKLVGLDVLDILEEIVDVDEESVVIVVAGIVPVGVVVAVGPDGIWLLLLHNLKTEKIAVTRNRGREGGKREIFKLEAIFGLFLGKHVAPSFVPGLVAEPPLEPGSWVVG